MKFLSKLAAFLMVFAFAANAECAAFCFSAVPSTHPCCDHKKPQRCANKAPLADYLLVESTQHSVAPQLFASAAYVLPVPTTVVHVSQIACDFTDPPDPARTIDIRRI